MAHTQQLGPRGFHAGMLDENRIPGPIPGREPKRGTSLASGAMEAAAALQPAQLKPSRMEEMRGQLKVQTGRPAVVLPSELSGCCCG